MFAIYGSPASSTSLFFTAKAAKTSGYYQREASPGCFAGTSCDLIRAQILRTSAAFGKPERGGFAGHPTGVWTGLPSDSMPGETRKFVPIWLPVPQGDPRSSSRARVGGVSPWGLARRGHWTSDVDVLEAVARLLVPWRTS